MRTERELLVDCLSRLNGAALDYMLTGSMASNFWGMPRTKHDLDFVVHLLRFAEERSKLLFVRRYSREPSFEPAATGNFHAAQAFSDHTAV